MAYDFTAVEKKWQRFWLENRTFRTLEPAEAGQMPKSYVLDMFNSYFDPFDQKAKPIAHLMNELVNENLVVAPDGSIKINPTQEGLEQITGEIRVERLWRELSEAEQRDVIDGQRLAYMDE